MSLISESDMNMFSNKIISDLIQSFKFFVLEEDDYEESKELRGSLLPKAKRNKGSNTIWGNGWIIM